MMKKTIKLLAKYHMLNSHQRLTLLTHAMVRNDRFDIDALTDTMPETPRLCCHHALLINAFFILASEYVVDQLNRAVRLCLFKFPADEGRALPSSVRLVAHDFLQHQTAWRQFSQRHDVPLDFPDCVHPSAASTLRLAAEIAGRLAFTDEQALAQVAGDSPWQPQTVEQIVSAWQRELERLAVPSARSDTCTDHSHDDTIADDSAPPLRHRAFPKSTDDSALSRPACHPERSEGSPALDGEATQSLP